MAPSLVQLFRHRFWLRSMLLIASLSVDFCWDWANHSNPTLGTSVTVRTMKGFLDGISNGRKETRNHSHQIGGGPLNLLNSISFVKTASQKALRSKLNGLSLCGLSGRAITPRILSSELGAVKHVDIHPVG